jgi:hypothetical protein
MRQSFTMIAATITAAHHYSKSSLRRTSPQNCGNTKSILGPPPEPQFYPTNIPPTEDSAGLVVTPLLPVAEALLRSFVSPERWEAAQAIGRDQGDPMGSSGL